MNLKKYIDTSLFFYSISDMNNFTKLNYETAEIMKSSSIDEFDKFNQEIFKNYYLMKSKFRITVIKI
ncbi:hypothetical protein I3900191A7_27230 [Clostridium baratii]